MHGNLISLGQVLDSRLIKFMKFKGTCCGALAHVIPPKYYKHLKKADIAKQFREKKMGWFLADLLLHHVILKS